MKFSSFIDINPSASGEMTVEEIECARTRESSRVRIEVIAAVARKCVTTARVAIDLETWIRRECRRDFLLLFLRHELVVLGEVHLQRAVDIRDFVEKLLRYGHHERLRPHPRAFAPQRQT